jgi:hypothetical protein
LQNSWRPLADIVRHSVLARPGRQSSHEIRCGLSRMSFAVGDRDGNFDPTLRGPQEWWRNHSHADNTASDVTRRLVTVSATATHGTPRIFQEVHRNLSMTSTISNNEPGHLQRRGKDTWRLNRLRPAGPRPRTARPARRIEVTSAVFGSASTRPDLAPETVPARRVNRPTGQVVA